MAPGTIKTIVGDRGFGFILPKGAVGEGLFFHCTDVSDTGFDTLREGDQVTYEESVDRRRGTPRAANVNPVSEGLS
jgi:CspA family cold shock protein